MPRIVDHNNVALHSFMPPKIVLTKRNNSSVFMDISQSLLNNKMCK